jgi:hypothetical protein
MQKVQYIEDFSLNSTGFSDAGCDCIASNTEYRSDILFFSRYKVLEPFAPYHFIELRG